MGGFESQLSAMTPAIAELWPPSGCSVHLPQKRCTLKRATSDGGFEPVQSQIVTAMATWLPDCPKTLHMCLAF